jgi:sporulation protein YlmC with PRC-barrel domain
VKPNILLYAALAIPTREDTRRCCTDEPPVVERPAALRRWSSKLRVAVPSSLRVFRRTVREPLERVPAGTPVRTTAGRDVGRVRDVVVALPSGRASYTVHDERDADARVLLIPRHALRTAGAHAVVEERVLEDVARSA